MLPLPFVQMPGFEGFPSLSFLIYSLLQPVSIFPTEPFSTPPLHFPPGAGCRAEPAPFWCKFLPQFGARPAHCQAGEKTPDVSSPSWREPAIHFSASCDISPLCKTSLPPCWQALGGGRGGADSPTSKFPLLLCQLLALCVTRHSRFASPTDSWMLALCVRSLCSVGELQPHKWEVVLALPPARGLPVCPQASADPPVPGSGEVSYTSTGQVGKR